jgi:ArsR family transcriptional regulator, arsenate/arsenite/antimonite-responsive transcriptional repressor
MTASELAVQPVPDSRAKDEKLARLAWGIAHPARLRILRVLLARKACICGELVDQLPLAQSTVSQHLKILKEAGLVTGEIDGPKVCYSVNPAVLAQLKELVAVL